MYVINVRGQSSSQNNFSDSQTQYDNFLATSFLAREELSFVLLLHYSGTKQFTPFKRDKKNGGLYYWSRQFCVCTIKRTRKFYIQALPRFTL